MIWEILKMFNGDILWLCYCMFMENVVYVDMWRCVVVRWDEDVEVFWLGLDCGC